MKKSVYMIAMLFSLLATVGATAQTYTESLLYSFSSASGGASQPTSGLVMDKSKNLYGASNGVVFKLSSSVLIRFSARQVEILL